jgi:thiamine biosynthesis lipoprotein
MMVLLAARSRPAAAETAEAERRLVTMGTSLELRVEASDRPAALRASEEAVAEISRIENLLSTWKPGGALDKLNRSCPGERVAVGREAANLLVEVEAWSQRTDGAFDPTVLPLVRAWGLRGEGRIPSDLERRRAIAAVGARHFRIDAERGEAARLSLAAGIDEGAWGKGYALDAAAARLKKAGVREALLDLGGQLLVLGQRDVSVADPRNRGRAAASLSLTDASLSTSGNSERGRTVRGRRVGHLLNPRSGRPAPDFGSATAIAPSGLVADILSTAFFVLGPEKGLALSERLRRAGFPNEALFLIDRGDRIDARSSPGLRFQLEGFSR